MSVDTIQRARVQQFLRRLGVSLVGGHDQTGAVAQQYGVESLPLTLLISPQGRVLALAHGARPWNTPTALQRIKASLAMNSQHPLP